MRMRCLSLALTLLLFATTTACYNAHGIRQSELGKLAGYRRGVAVEVQDFSGRTIDFDERAKLFLVRQNGDQAGGHFDSIDIQEGRFLGRTDDGKNVNLLLRDVQQASIDTYSRGQTIAGIIV